MKKTLLTGVAVATVVATLSGCAATDKSATTAATQPSVNEAWDKVFALSDAVNHRKVSFKNRFGITLVADLYEPKQYSGKLACIREH